MARSAGILLFKRTPDLEVLLVHPGGPFWANKDDGAWSIPKGEYDAATEDAYATARREFREETGFDAPDGEPIDLGEVVQRAGKVVHGFGLEGDLAVDGIASNTFEMEWPPRSGRRQRFPEVDRAAWSSVDEARARLNPAQVELVERLAEAVR